MNKDDEEFQKEFVNIYEDNFKTNEIKEVNDTTLKVIVGLTLAIESMVVEHQIPRGFNSLEEAVESFASLIYDEIIDLGDDTEDDLPSNVIPFPTINKET